MEIQTQKIDVLIEVLVERVYGIERFYPYNDNAKLLSKITKRPTLTKKQLMMIKQAGWQVIARYKDYVLE